MFWLKSVNNKFNTWINYFLTWTIWFRLDSTNFKMWINLINLVWMFVCMDLLCCLLTFVHISGFFGNFGLSCYAEGLLFEMLTNEVLKCIFFFFNFNQKNDNGSWVWAAVLWCCFSMVWAVVMSRPFISFFFGYEGKEIHFLFIYFFFWCEGTLFLLHTYFIFYIFISFLV